MKLINSVAFVYIMVLVFVVTLAVQSINSASFLPTLLFLLAFGLAAAAVLGGLFKAR